jgi:alpha-1,2-mannosyltransferase
VKTRSVPVDRLVLLGIIVMFVVLAVPFVVRGYSEFDAVYVQAARDLMAGADIYAPGRAYLYPPFMTLLAAPFAALPHLVMRAAWYLVNVASVIGLIGWSWRLAGGPPFRQIFAQRRDWLAALLGLVCAERYISNALSHQQTDISIACLIMASCVALTRQRGVAAGALLGLAAACKATPLLFAPYLAWRRQWVASGLLVVIAIGANLLPNLVEAPRGGGTWLTRWLSTYVVGVGDPNAYPGTWGAGAADNQSLAGLVGRLVTTSWTWSAAGIDVVARDPFMDPGTARALVIGALLALCAVSLWAIGRSREIAWNAEHNGAVARPALECGIILCLMLLASPMSSRAHFGTLVLPAFCVARHALQSHDRMTWSLLGIAMLAGLANRDFVGDDLSSLALWCGFPTFGTIALLLGCIGVVRRTPADMGVTEAGGRVSPSGSI